MNSQIRVNIENSSIIIGSSFAKKASKFDSQEYRMLQRCREDYPSFTVVRRKIARNSNKECYKGLTYEYMEKYIRLHSTNQKQALFEFSEMKLKAECHSIRYPTIKKWFLKQYPEIAEFGMDEVDNITMANTLVA